MGTQFRAGRLILEVILLLTCFVALGEGVPLS